MTLDEKTLLQAKPTTKALAYTATNKTIIRNILLCNNTAGTATITIWVDSDGSDANDENMIIAPFEYPSKIASSKNVYIVLEVGGTITLQGTGMAVTISGAELI